MSSLLTFLATTFAILLADAVFADTTEFVHGGDTYISGGTITRSLDTAGDSFVSGRRIVAGGTSQGDMHVAGFDLTINTNAAQDLYAMGATVLVRGTVAQDLTAMGFSVRTDPTAAVAGNVRLMANTVTIEGPIKGALAAMGTDVILNAPVEGDVRLLAKSITFGPNAVVSGTLSYSTQDKITVPERVAPAERVVFEKLDMSEAWEGWEDVRKEMPVLPTFASVLFGFVVTLLFYVVLAALMLTFMPRRLEKMRKGIAKAPGKSILLGVVGLALLIGAIPITALTIVGLPFVPVVILALVVGWVLAYALGAYSIAMWVFSAVGGQTEPATVARLAVFAGAITIIALLNYIPFVGWVANYTLVLLGMGAMTNAAFQFLLGNPDVALDIDMKPIES